MNGGRFNPPDSFSTLYLCETRACAVAELIRACGRHGVDAGALLPRVLYRYDLDLARVLDLTRPDVREHIGVSERDLAGDDWSVCQTIGREAHDRGDQAIRTLSATGVDRVLVVFPELLGESLLDVTLVERWNAPSDL